LVVLRYFAKSVAKMIFAITWTVTHWEKVYLYQHEHYNNKHYHQH